MTLPTQIIQMMQSLGVLFLQCGCALISGTVVFQVFRKSKDILAQTGFAYLYIIFTILSMICVIIPSTTLYLFVGLMLVYVKKENLSYTQIIFLLWSIVNGYIIGKEMLLEVFLTTIIIAGCMYYAKQQTQHIYELSITCFDEPCEKQVMRYIEQVCVQFELRFKTISEHGIQIELKIVLTNHQILEQLGSITGVEKAQLSRRNPLW